MTILRPEALPLDWDRLTESQQDAFGRIAGWLAAAVDELPNPRSGERNRRDAVLSRRTSGVCLVSGDRGTGKTSLLLTLKDMCRPGTSTVTFGLRSDVQADVKKLAARVVWLESLDMDTLPGPTNLLAAILARVRKSLATSERDSSQPRSILGASSDCEAARTTLEQMQTQIASAWRRRLPASIDGEIYASEVTDMETRRLEVNSRLEDVLDSLAVNEPWPPPVENPLFVLPVDDVDLNPFRCLELFQLLRMITTPRLFSLVLGDERIAEAVTTIQLSGQYARLARRASREQFVAIPPPLVTAIVGATASKIIRKVLPPSQRARLGPMRIDKALDYQPRPTAGKAEEARTLRSLMENIYLQDLRESFDARTWALQPVQSSDPSLRDFLIGPKAPAKKEPSPSDDPNSATQNEQTALTVDDTEPYPYWAAQLLQAPARQVADLWLLLNPLAGDRPETGAATRGAKLLDTLSELLRNLIEEDPCLSAGQRQEVLAGLQKDPAGRLVFQTDVLSIDREFGPATTLGTKWCVAKVHQTARWRLGQPVAPEAPPESSKPPPIIEDRTAAAVMLVHDLVAMGKTGTLLGGSIASTVGSNGWFAAEWNLGASTAAVPWPEPDWLTFRAFDQFAWHWQRASQDVQKLPTSSNSAEMFAFTFLSCVLDVADRAAVKRKPTGIKWDELGKRLALLLDADVNQCTPEIRRTLPVTFACALAPESAPFLDKSDVAKIAKVLKSFWSDPACARAIRAARLQSVKPFYDPGVPGGPLAHLLVSPHSFEERLRSEFVKAHRALAQVQHDSPGGARTVSPALPTKQAHWGEMIENLLAEIEAANWTSRPRNVRVSATQRTLLETDLPRTVAFLREVVEGLDKTLAMSRAHPINTECRRSLCPWQADLDRLEAAVIAAS